MEGGSTAEARSLPGTPSLFATYVERRSQLQAQFAQQPGEFVAFNFAETRDGLFGLFE